MPRNQRIVLGLNSGTSADGIDAVACVIRGHGLGMKVAVVGHVQVPYAPVLRDRILAVMAPARTSTEELCRLNRDIGDAFAGAAELAVKKLGLKRLDLIGSHGQTIAHYPPSSSEGRRRSEISNLRFQNGSTLQIGEPALIAARLGVPVVSQFRQLDIALGGQGAPLVPWTDYVLFRHARRTRVLQNIGGIANLTFLPAGGDPSDVIAYDTGPGNVVIDALVRHFTMGRETFDRGGRRAAKGKVNEALAAAMREHDYFRRRPPKSCGREQFGEAWTQSLLRRFKNKQISQDDWIATATTLTAETVANELAKIAHVSNAREWRILELILCGGGARNKTLVRLLKGHLTARLGDQAPDIQTTDDYGIPTQAKEGASFAVLAAARMDRVPTNLPQVTGASRPTLIGSITEQ